MADHSEEIAAGRISDFGDKDTEHIARFLEHSGAPAMAALVRQRWADQEELRAAVKFAAWLCQQPKPQMEVAVRYFDRILGPSFSGSSEEADRGLATGGVVSSDQALLVGEGGCLLPPSSARVTGSEVTDEI